MSAVPASSLARDRWRNALILHFEAAKSLRAALEDCPRWRWRKRRRLARGLERECRAAEIARLFLGASPDARPLRELVDLALGLGR